MPFVDLSDTSLFYTEVGMGLPCLVMHMGLGFDHTSLRSGLDPLADLLHLIYYDHRGNGRSGRPPLDTLTFAQLADDADRLREHLHLDKIAVLGHSYGGFIALHYALRYPHRLTHLMLMTTAPAWDYGEEILTHARRKGATPEMLAALDFARYTDDDQLREAVARLGPLYFHRFDARLATKVLKETIYSASAARQGGQLLRHYDLVDRLHEITMPTLILCGQDDFVTPPSQAHRLHRGIPGSQLVVFEHSGHFPFVEEPEAFLSAVRGWVCRRTRPSA